MRFAVAVLTPEASTPVTVDVDADPSTSVSRFAQALYDELGLEAVDGAGPGVHVGAHPVDPEVSLAEAGVRDGVSVGLGRPAAPDLDLPGVVELKVVGGAGAGLTYRLVPGHYDLGVGAQCVVGTPEGPPVSATVTVRSSGEVAITAVSDDIDLSGDPLDAGAAAPWPIGALVTAGGVLLEVGDPAVRTAAVTLADDGSERHFNRPPRRVDAPSSLRLRLPRAVGDAPRSAVPVLPLVLMPIVASLLTVVITGNWRFIVLGLLSPVAAMWSRSGNSKAQQRAHELRVVEHDETKARIRRDLDEALAAEQRLRRRAHPDPATLLTMASLPTDRLWERRRTDADFLAVRVGTGTVASRVTLEDANEDEHRRESVPALVEVPVVLDLSTVGVLGIVGDAEAARWIVAQVCVLHSPADIDLCVLAGEGGAARWGWTRWLPHLRYQDRPGQLALGTSTDSVARRIAELVQVVEARLASRAARAAVDHEKPVLLVLDGARRLRSLPGVVSLLRDGPGVGVHLVCLDTEEERLPEECTAVLRTHTAADGVEMSGVLALADGTEHAVRPDVPEASWYDLVARSLAPLRGAVNDDDSVLPDTVRLVHLLGLAYPTMADDVAGRWVLAPRSTSAPLGIGLDGPFELDIVRDGPHGLIAGTTGSGKSELLQTLVASLAVANRPDELTFVLVDYKGGSAFAECADLPHTVGLVTDLDTQQVERALTSLGAELRRREHVLADAGAKDIADYIERRELDRDLAPLPRLLIVIDEFASMVRELPDFVTGLVNLAQRGRSLGIHLILATQRPSGAVSSDIRANTNLRIALRTTDATESRDIIDAPDSAELPPSLPGRAYARLNASLLLPFQAARVGGRRAGSDPTDRPRHSPVYARHLSWAELGGATHRLDDPGRATSSRAPGAAEAGSADASTDITTDIALLARALSRAAEQLEIAPSRRPWLPPLPGRVDLDLDGGNAPTPSSEDGVVAAAAWGLIDDPERQEQRSLLLDLATTGHLHLIGASQSGRSQALRSLTVALATAVATRDLHVYAVDCGTGALNTLDALPHVGAVVDHRSPERLGRLLGRLGEELSVRQRLLGSHGAADLTELRRRLPAAERPPHVVLLVDRFEVFDRDFASFDNGSLVERMSALLRDGAAVGIHLVLAGDRTLASSRYAGSTEDKLILRLNDQSDWSMVGIRPKEIPDALPAGRALRAGSSLTIQIGVLPTPDDAEVTGSAQAAAIEQVARTLAARDAGTPADHRPRSLLALPDRIGLAAVLARPHPIAPGRTIVAVGGDDLAALGPDLVETPTFLVAGPPRSGRSTALLTLAASALRDGAGLVVVAPRRGPLRDLAGHPAVSAVITESENLSALLREALSRVPQQRGILVIDDAEMVLTSDAGNDIHALARGAAGEGWALVVAGNADALSSSLGGWLAPVRRNRQGLLLAPQSPSEGELIGARLARGSIGGRPPVGRGVLHLGDGEVVSVQVPESDVAQVLADATDVPAAPHG